MVEPFPTELRVANESELEEDIPDAPRMLFCVYYERCLNFAVKQRWENWTCAHCSLANQQARRPRVHDFASCGRKENSWA